MDIGWWADEVDDEKVAAKVTAAAAASIGSEPETTYLRPRNDRRGNHPQRVEESHGIWEGWCQLRPVQKGGDAVDGHPAALEAHNRGTSSYLAEVGEEGDAKAVPTSR